MTGSARFVAIGSGLMLSVAAGAPVLADIDLVTSRYVCERGVEVPVAYVNADAQSVAVLTVEGQQIALWQEPSGSGARYAWPSDGSGYVWWSKGSDATLLWRDGAAQTETPILKDCRSD